jgi:homoserine kinase type II|tara:strand:+ start:1274 stop:2230 length:957 start_codon:yes stop_codon:yes gene_type:complete
MAVFTTLDSHDIEMFLKDYDLGTLERFEGIVSGVENTNYHIFTSQGRYVLTVHEGKVIEADLPFFLGYIQYLRAKGVPTCEVLAQNDGALYGLIKGKTAAISAFLEGADTALSAVQPEQCHAVGEMLAKMHIMGGGFDEKRENKMGLSAWHNLWMQTAAQADSVVPNQKRLVDGEFERLMALWPDLASRNMPTGAVHCDMFADNVFFKDGKLSGIIDFYYACDEYYIYDLALTVNAWCFDERAVFVKARYDAMMDGYKAQRPLSTDEQAVFNMMLRASALRIQMTRLYDYLNHPGDDVVVPHDPKAFLKRISYWKEQA